MEKISCVPDAKAEGSQQIKTNSLEIEVISFHLCFVAWRGPKLLRILVLSKKPLLNRPKGQKLIHGGPDSGPWNKFFVTLLRLKSSQKW